MYLRTPKRYGRGARQRNVVSLRWLWLWLLTPLIVFIGLMVYNNQETLRPQISEALSGMVDSARDTVATISAPTPTVTADPAPQVARANEAWQRGAIEQAVEIYREVISALPNDLTAHYQYTLGLIMQDRDDEALLAAENAVTANPFASDAWAIRAMAQNNVGDYGKAIASALRALELVPASAVRDNPTLAAPRARALAFLAEAYYNNDQFERALGTIEEAITLNPDCFECYYVRGLINWYYNIDRSAAFVDFQTAYELMPNMIYIGAVMSYLEAEIQLVRQNAGEAADYTQAQERITQILQLNPGNSRALYWMGDYFFRINGEPAQASDYLSRCTQANPDYARCHYLLGRSLNRQELYSDALISFQAAVETALPGDELTARYYYWLAETELQLTNLVGCVTTLQTAAQFAQELGDQVVLDAYPTLAQQCGATVLQPTPLPAPEATSEAGS